MEALWRAECTHGTAGPEAFSSTPSTRSDEAIARAWRRGNKCRRVCERLCRSNQLVMDMKAIFDAESEADERAPIGGLVQGGLRTGLLTDQIHMRLPNYYILSIHHKGCAANCHARGMRATLNGTGDNT